MIEFSVNFTIIITTLYKSIRQVIEPFDGAQGDGVEQTDVHYHPHPFLNCISYKRLYVPPWARSVA